MKNFFKYAALSIALQGTLWLGFAGVSVLLSPKLDSYLEKFIYLYHPTIVIVARYGDFKGETNITRPILYGVPLGILLYSALLATILRTLDRRRPST
jgi:hypothetical protein